MVKTLPLHFNSLRNCKQIKYLNYGTDFTSISRLLSSTQRHICNPWSPKINKGVGGWGVPGQ